MRGKLKLTPISFLVATILLAVGIFSFDSVFAQDGPKGKIAFTRWEKWNWHPSIWIVNADGSNAKQITIDNDSSFPCWLPDGRLVFGKHHLAHPAYGNKLFPTEIWVSKADGSEAKLIIAAKKPFNHIKDIACSPTELKIAYAQESSMNGWDVWAVEVDGTKPVGLTVEKIASYKRNNRAPSFSPDGKKILFAADIKQDSDPTRSPVGTILEIVLNNPKEEKILVHDPLERYSWPRISPKGDKLIFYREGSETLSIGAGGLKHWLMVANGDGTGEKVFYQEGAEPCWSPDGRYLGFITDEGLWTIDKEGESPVKILDGENLEAPAWQGVVTTVNKAPEKQATLSGAAKQAVRPSGKPSTEDTVPAAVVGVVAASAFALITNAQTRIIGSKGGSPEAGKLIKLGLYSLLVGVAAFIISLVLLWRLRG